MRVLIEAKHTDKNGQKHIGLAKGHKQDETIAKAAGVEKLCCQTPVTMTTKSGTQLVLTDCVIWPSHQGFGKAEYDAMVAKVGDKVCAIEVEVAAGGNAVEVLDLDL